jgi:hypothetical protein
MSVAEDARLQHSRKRTRHPFPLTAKVPLTTNPQNKHQTTQRMTNTITSNVAAKAFDTPPAGVSERKVDLKRGATQFGIYARILLPTRILADYEEVDSTLGRNTAGMVLAVISCRLAAGNIGLRNEVVTVCLRRRRDGQTVEVDLELRRARDRGQECFSLCFAGERKAGS